MTLPLHPSGQQLSALQVSMNPPRFVYGEPDVLEWLRNELMERTSSGMPRPQDKPVNWR